MRLAGWNDIPKGYGARFDTASAPAWLRIMHATPFLERFSYPCWCNEGSDSSGRSRAGGRVNSAPSLGLAHRRSRTLGTRFSCLPAPRREPVAAPLSDAPDNTLYCALSPSCRKPDHVSLRALDSWFAGTSRCLPARVRICSTSRGDRAAAVTSEDQSGATLVAQASSLHAFGWRTRPGLWTADPAAAARPLAKITNHGAGPRSGSRRRTKTGSRCSRPGPESATAAVAAPRGDPALETGPTTPASWR